MPISYVGGATGTTSATLPAHQAGDVIIAFAFRDGSTTQATQPSGWTQIRTATTTSTAGRCAYKVATSSSEVTGTWTNATSVAFAIYRGVDNTFPVPGTTGSSAQVANTTANITYPALSAMSGESGSWVVAMAGHRSTNTTLETPPSGMTNRLTLADATDEIAFHDTDGSVSSWSAQTVTLGGTSSGKVGFVVELLSGEGITTTDWVQGTTASVFTPADFTGGATWVNPANAVGDDATNATLTNPANGKSEALKISGFSGLSIPAGASIRGVDVRVNGGASQNGPNDLRITLGAGLGSNPIDSVNFVLPSTSVGSGASSYTIGQAAQRFGGVDTNDDGTFDRDWTAEDFGSDFSVNLQVVDNIGGFTATMSVDDVSVRVRYYQDPNNPTGSYSASSASTTTYAGSATMQAGYSASSASTLDYSGSTGTVVTGSYSGTETSDSVITGVATAAGSYSALAVASTAYAGNAAMQAGYSAASASTANYAGVTFVAVDGSYSASSTSTANYAGAATSTASYSASSTSTANYAGAGTASGAYSGTSASTANYAGRADHFSSYTAASSSALAYTHTTVTLVNGSYAGSSAGTTAYVGAASSTGQVAVSGASTTTYSGTAASQGSYSATSTGALNYVGATDVALTNGSYTANSVSSTAYSGVATAAGGYFGASASSTSYSSRADLSAGYSAASAGAIAYTGAAFAFSGYSATETSSLDYQHWLITYVVSAYSGVATSNIEYVGLELLEPPAPATARVLVSWKEWVKQQSGAFAWVDRTATFDFKTDVPISASVVESATIGPVVVEDDDELVMLAVPTMQSASLRVPTGVM